MSAKLLLLTAVFSLALPAQVRYSIASLAPAGSISSAAYGLAGDGSVVGTAELSCYCGTHAFRYKAGAITDLGTLGGADSTALAINTTGQIAGHSRLVNDTAVHAFSFSGSAITDLGTLGGGDSFARAINDSGQVAGYSDTFGARHAFLYSSGVYSDIGTLGGTFAQANAINSSGQIAGASSLAGDMVVHAYLRTAGTNTDLGTLGGSTSAAAALNDNGQVAGYSNTSGDASVHAFLYAGGNMRDLGAAGGDFSMARAINARGDVVGMTSSGAFLYSNGVMVDLNQAIDSASGWKLEDATAINNAGQIAGYGTLNGQTAAFLLDPLSQPPAAQGPLSSVAPSEILTASAGAVNFEKYEYPDFDVYTDDPTPAQKQFMGDHFYRMSVFSPYFDSRLSWFPRATVYIISYGIANADPLVQQHPEWILHDASGNLLYIPFNCSGGTCPHYAADIANPAFRAWWIANAQTELAHGYQGIWLDDVNLDFLVSDGNSNPVSPIDDNTGQAMTQDGWRTYMDTYLEEIRYSFPGAVMEHNSIWYSDTGGVRDANPFIQRQIAAADVIHMERGIGSDPGLQGGTGLWGVSTVMGYIDRVHAKNKPVTLQDFFLDTAGQEYSAAAYFLVSAGRDTTGDRTTTPDNLWPGYTVDLGLPSGPRTYDAGLFERRFDKGMVLLNDPNAATITVTLDGVYTRPDGSSNTSVTLAGKTGAVLTKVGPVTGGRWLSDLSWLSATNGYLQIQHDVSTNGNILTLNGNRYLKGLGAHADSEIHYDLGGACTSFAATVGIDDEVPAGTGSGDFKVVADGVTKFASGHMTGGSPAQTVNVDLTGVEDLALIVTDDGFGIGNSHSDWAGAFLRCTSF
ncbi:MAG TPA: NPCBM/NEW2 domain-containing protein [Bryobacteraceae bacterium]|jgi:probable HAF family extracellular repeat protein|nr:NPCBM/NEW2 domain-containing protein [Bryobacteraceae bacterium]